MIKEMGIFDRIAFRSLASRDATGAQTNTMRGSVMVGIFIKVAMVMLGVLMTLSVRAQTWDIASDFSLTNNPSGTWSFGWERKLGETFHPYDLLWGAQKGVKPKGFWGPGWFGPVRAWCKQRSDANQMCKQLPPPGVLPYPDHWVEAGFSHEEVVKQAAGLWSYPDPYGYVSKNVSAGAFALGGYWEPGGILLMPPGKLGKDANVVSRWTAPAAGLYLVNARFTGQRYQVDAGMKAHVGVLHNGEALFSGKINGFVGSASEHFDDALGPEPEQDCSEVLSLPQGDTVDFAVGTSDNFNYGIFGVENMQLLPCIGLEVNVSRVCNEQTKLRRWVAAKFGGTLSAGTTATGVAHYGEDSTTPPFSFVYGGKPSSDLLGTWQIERTTTKPDAERTEHTLIFTDPKTGLVVRCVGVEYQDFPTIEWTVYFNNSGAKDTPILEDIRPVDMWIKRGPIGEFVLHRIIGERLLATTLKPNMVRHLGGALPYLNFGLPGEGLILALSWPGDLSCEFARDDDSGLHIHGGQATTHFKLHPGEEVRTPMVVLQFWNGGDVIHAQNTWRRWMIAYNMPEPGGKPLKPQLSASSAYQYGNMTHATEDNQKRFIARYVAAGLKPDFWWMDAGWYPPNNGLPLWGITGTWVPDKKRFPNGLRAITDYAHARGIKSIVWFQPERVSPGTWLYVHHPEWLLGTEGADKLFDLGNPAARQWAVDYFSQFVKDQGIDIFRMDTNIGFTQFWSAHDTPDRQGITEIRYAEGYLAFLDEMLRRNPRLRIDHWRIDLETLRRSAPLILSTDFNSIGDQCFNYRMSFWLPWHGLCSRTLDAYDFRSMMCTAVATDWDLRNNKLNTKLGRRLIHEWRHIAPDYFGDYYPLTPYGFDNETWMAWQFNRPKAGDGVVQAFRRLESGHKSELFKLRGLDPGACYKVRNFDKDTSQILTGRELMEQGITISIMHKPGAAVITYHRMSQHNEIPQPHI